MLTDPNSSRTKVLENRKKHMRSTKRAVVYIIASVLVLAFAILLIDQSRTFSKRRHAQNAADSAALSAALAKARRQDFASAALVTAEYNGFNNDGITNTVQVYDSPTVGPYSGTENCLQVIITFPDPSFLGVKQETKVEAAACIHPQTQEAISPVFPHLVLLNGGGPVIPTAPVALVAQFAEIDNLLKSTIESSIAYNKPEKMKLEETVSIELLINPSISSEELSNEIREGGAIGTGTVEISPRMSAYLYTYDSSALIVQPLHNDPEQLIGKTSTTNWSWSIKAIQGGTHTLTLVIFRLVKYDGKDYWREVKSYQSDIQVTVSFGQMLKSLDWKWVLPTVATALLIPGLWRWYERRSKENNMNKETEQLSSSKKVRKKAKK
jgi:hypothetical protein